MKKQSNLKTIFALFAITLTISACKKDTPTQTIEGAGIGFVHASPGTGALDFIVNNNKVNSKDFTYTNDIGYFTAYPGAMQLGVVNKGDFNYITSRTVNLKSGSFYSVFVADTLKKRTLLVFEDDLKAPETDKAKVRFLNLSPDAPTLNLSIQGQPNALFTAKAFKEITDFTSVTPSDNYTFEVSETANSNVKTTLPAVKIEKGKIYTIWAKGLKTPTDSTKFGIAVLTHK